MRLLFAVIAIATGWYAGTILMKHGIKVTDLDGWLLIICICLGMTAGQQIFKQRRENTKS